MFLVKDKSENREKRIRALLITDPPLAVIMAAVHFEWTIQRAIISLSKQPNSLIREILINHKKGLKNYKEIWKVLLTQETDVPRLTSIIDDWKGLKEGFKLRNELVHGVSSCSKIYATPKIESLINASLSIRKYCANLKIDLDAKLKVKKRQNSPSPLRK